MHPAKLSRIVSSLNPLAQERLLIRLPSASSTRVSKMSCSGVRLRKNSIPVVSLKVFRQVLHG